jgi:hypothetical protein
MKNLAALVRTRTPNNYHGECDPALMDDLLDEIQAFITRSCEASPRILRARTPAQATLEGLAGAKRILQAALAISRASKPLTDDPWVVRAEAVLQNALDALRV